VVELVYKRYHNYLIYIAMYWTNENGTELPVTAAHTKLRFANILIYQACRWQT